MLDQLTVKQDRGKDSTVEIYEETVRDWNGNKKGLRFVTDQSLASSSDRANNVHRAIEDYARSRGYDFKKPNSNYELLAVYNPDTHSHVTEFKIRTQIKNDVRFMETAHKAQQERDDINRQYGIVIRQLRNLVFQLEQQNRKKLERIGQELVEVQRIIASEIEIPDHVIGLDRERLLEPQWPYVKIERDGYNDYGQQDVLPSNLDNILSLLED